MTGLSLMGNSGELCEKAIREHLTASFIGRDIIILPEVDSTNSFIKKTGAADAYMRPREGLVVIADGQTGGRGRMGRTFVSEKGEGAYFSVLLKPDAARRDIRFITICAAVAASKAIEAACGVRADIKWVNDIYCNGKKVAGILTETVTADIPRGRPAGNAGGEQAEDFAGFVPGAGDGCSAGNGSGAGGEQADDFAGDVPGAGSVSVVTGIGINTGRAPAGLSDIAASIREVSGKRVDRNRLIAGVLNQFERAYVDYIERGRKREIVDYYAGRLFIKGKRILVTESASDGASGYAATALGIDDTGALLVRDGEGAVRRVSTGEIKLKW